MLRPCNGGGCCCFVIESCWLLWNPMDCSPPGSSVHGISQARTVEWVVFYCSRGTFQPRDQMNISYLAEGLYYYFFNHCTTWEDHAIVMPKFWVPFPPQVVCWLSSVPGRLLKKQLKMNCWDIEKASRIFGHLKKNKFELQGLPIKKGTDKYARIFVETSEGLYSWEKDNSEIGTQLNQGDLPVFQLP